MISSYWRIVLETNFAPHQVQRLVLGADNGATYHELFKYNSIQRPILALNGQQTEINFNPGMDESSHAQ